LTAFVGGENHTQLTIQTDSTIQGQAGIAYISLNNDDVDKLIFGLLERKLMLVSATGEEKSCICPDSND